jgi:hypothetical protein
VLPAGIGADFDPSGRRGCRESDSADQSGARNDYRKQAMAASLIIIAFMDGIFAMTPKTQQMEEI